MHEFVSKIVCTPTVLLFGELSSQGRGDKIER